ncbi:hypothetical protein NQ317_012061 [Molorchus minor]|uniref:Uncharacterized protein n=1 Tax=Molorchus minor TaxID=1323400 RepID=A0ABQ9K5D1_9CUCU|nr:hypothetical protein NQ317_012061 [Molorchus minor]
MEANVYDDIDDFDLGEEIERCSHKVTQEDVEKLTATVEKLNSNQDILKTNISRLFLTAKEEIARKDRMIADLRSQLDDICFRRNMPDSRPDLKRKEIEETVEAVVTKKFKSDSTEEKSHDVDHRSKSKPRPEQNSDTFSARDTKSRSKSIEREDRYKNRSRRHEDRDRKHRYRKEVFDVDGRRERSKSLKYEDNRRYSRYSNQDVRKRSDSPKYNSYDHSLHEANKILERNSFTNANNNYSTKGFFNNNTRCLATPHDEVDSQTEIKDKNKIHSLEKSVTELGMRGSYCIHIKEELDNLPLIAEEDLLTEFKEILKLIDRLNET